MLNLQDLLSHVQRRFGLATNPKARKVHGKLMGHIDPTLGVTVTETGNEILTKYTASNVSATGGTFGHGFVTLAAGGSVKFASGVTKTATSSVNASRLDATSVVLIYRHVTGSFSYHWQAAGYTPVGDEIIIGTWDNGDFTPTLAGKITTVVEARTPEQQLQLNAAFDADSVDGLHARNAAGVSTADPYLPVADGQINPNLNADLLDGRSSEGFAFRAGFEDTNANNSQVVRTQRLGRDENHYVITGAELALYLPDGLKWGSDNSSVEVGELNPNTLYTLRISDNTLHHSTRTAVADSADNVTWTSIQNRPVHRGDGSAGLSADYITDENNNKLRSGDSDALGGRPASRFAYQAVYSFNTGVHGDRDAFIQLPGEPIYLAVYHLNGVTDRSWTSTGGYVAGRYPGLADNPAGAVPSTDPDPQNTGVWWDWSATMAKLPPYMYNNTAGPFPSLTTNTVGWYQDANGKYWGVISEGAVNDNEDIVVLAIMKS